MAGGRREAGETEVGQKGGRRDGAGRDRGGKTLRTFVALNVIYYRLSDTIAECVRAQTCV